ncbi:nuclear transport factor 2 family protein [Dietzia cercidiphylli]|uniref:Nuclear transport factor 2 family protein n=1 Tax=Dietzia cercidiphylli TaxID=498199 RepID=A0ABN2J5E8_9ACTN|nr:nuclear transport factor 2 family protein [Dietzia cercidiphylli]MBB1046382.1 nuclear transport factor 2 family protein [Dietzia cercidiphylli]
MTEGSMSVTGLEHCGNSPRTAITAQILLAWAQGDDSTLASWLADDVSHTLVGSSSDTPCHGTAATLRSFRAPGPMTRLVVHGLLSHGKEAACDGTATLEDGTVVHFAHHATFTSAGKKEKVREIRTYQYRRT